MASTVPPMRGAALKATASIAEQLTDSPGPSEGDSNPFHEPATRTKSVKYRYTATGKHLSSPLKGSSSSPERKSKKSRLATFTPAPSHAAKGKAPAVAPTSRKRKASLRKEDLLDSMFASSPSPLSSVPASPITSTKDLPPSPTLTAIQNPPKRRPVSKALSLRSLGTSASKFSVLSQPLSPGRKQKKNRPNTQKGADAWDIGNSVWVLVKRTGVLADTNAPQSSTDPEPLMWWPAQVVRNEPLDVSMFGECPHQSKTMGSLRTIFNPSSSNVLSIHDDSGAKRFSRTTFRLGSWSADDGAGPPAKKPRLDVASLEARWEAAVECMNKASTLEEDGLPALLSSYATAGGTFYDTLDDSDPDTSDFKQSMSKSTATKKPKPTDSARKLKLQRSRSSVKVHETWKVDRPQSPCHADPTLQIPGELVLAMAPRTGGSYWPAKILEHVPALKEKYLVKFLDDEEYALTRDRFFTSEEEGFVQCTLGEWESAVKTTDDPESGDEGDDAFGTDDANQDLDDAALPPPPPAADFEDLSVRAQLSYVKPVLRAILTKQYPPAREKHEAFMKGGPARVTLLKSAGVRGGMDTRFIKAVQKVLCRWVVGESGVRPEKMEIGDTVPGNGEAEATSAVQATLPEGPLHDSTQDDKMEGIEGTAPEDEVAAKDTANETVTASDQQAEVAQVVAMTVDRHEQDPVSLPPPTKGVTLSPAIQQAALAPKSQLDLLAEVSQAVATEPSLLPSHPELPKLKVQLLDMPRKDTSPQPSPLTPVPDEGQLRPRPPRRTSPPVVSEEFEALSGIEKLDYCLNILLPESIQQILLWRSGERISSALLPPEEEQRLHEVGVRKAAETDWVDDLMRLRAAQARLWGVDLNKKPEEKKPEAVQGGTRSRPRRGTVSRG